MVILIRLPPHTLVGTCLAAARSRHGSGCPPQAAASIHYRVAASLPRGEGKHVAGFTLLTPKNILLLKGFAVNEKHKTLAFPAGEGVASSCGGDG